MISLFVLRTFFYKPRDGSGSSFILSRHNNLGPAGSGSNFYRPRQTIGPGWLLLTSNTNRFCTVNALNGRICIRKRSGSITTQVHCCHLNDGGRQTGGSCTHTRSQPVWMRPQRGRKYSTRADTQPRPRSEQHCLFSSTHQSEHIPSAKPTNLGYMHYGTGKGSESLPMPDPIMKI